MVLSPCFLFGSPKLMSDTLSSMAMPLSSHLFSSSLSTMRLNVDLSMAQRMPLPTAWMVAARGMLYMSASSPKLPSSVYEPTCLFVPLMFTKMWYFPLEGGGGGRLWVRHLKMRSLHHVPHENGKMYQQDSIYIQYVYVRGSREHWHRPAKKQQNKQKC